MVIFAVIASSMSGVDGIPLLRPYIGAGLAITFLSALIWMFLKIAKMAFSGIEHPMMRVSESLKDRWKILIFPALLFPIFGPKKLQLGATASEVRAESGVIAR